MRKLFALWLLLASVTFQAHAADPSECATLHDWGDVPAEARASLEALVGPVAGKHEKFNSTDVAWAGLPFNRFFSGCRQDGLVAVSLERGGRGYSIQVFHYSAGKATKRWTYMRTKDPDAIDLLHAPLEGSQAP